MRLLQNRRNLTIGLIACISQLIWLPTAIARGSLGEAPNVPFTAPRIAVLHAAAAGSSGPSGAVAVADPVPVTTTPPPTPATPTTTATTTTPATSPTPSTSTPPATPQEVIDLRTTIR